MLKYLMNPLFMIQRTCEIVSGYSKQNCVNGGGITSLVICSKENLDAYVLNADGVNIDSMSMVATKKCYTITPDLESSSYTQTPTRSRENNSYFVAQTVMAILKDDTSDTQELTNDTGKGFLLVIARQANGLNRVFGLMNGMTLDTEENVSGQLYDDLNGSTLNFIGKELIKAPLISDVIVDALLIPSS